MAIQAIINKSYFFQDSDVSNSMLISSKHGQRYQCTLPQLETEETIKDARTEFTTEEVTDLLKPMQNRCLYHVSILIKIGSIDIIEFHFICNIDYSQWRSEGGKWGDHPPLIFWIKPFCLMNDGNATGIGTNETIFLAFMLYLC